VPRLAHGSSIVLTGDFHVHSFPGDGSLPPWDIAREARRRGLDVVALTNHNSLLSSRLARMVPSPSGGALLIPSQELTAAGYHMGAIGVPAPIEWRQSAASAAAEIRARGGVAIAFHPAGQHARSFDAALDVLDGIEAAHPLIHVFEGGRRDLEALHQRARAQRPSIAAIGSTDFHHFAPVGLARTYLFARDASRDAVLDAIRRGATVACDGAGGTHGPAELVAVVDADCRRAATAPPAGSGAADTIATVCTWLGALGLVLAGAFERG
jgi:predicted metal-dependent phosphoesterase TrpH